MALDINWETMTIFKACLFCSTMAARQPTCILRSRRVVVILFKLSGISQNRFFYNQVAIAIPPVAPEIPDVTCPVPASKGPVVWPMFTISSGP
jgi:hypothetical protein